MNLPITRSIIQGKPTSIFLGAQRAHFGRPPNAPQPRLATDVGQDVDEKGEETDFERRPVDTRSVEIAGGDGGSVVLGGRRWRMCKVPTDLQRRCKNCTAAPMLWF